MVFQEGYNLTLPEWTQEVYPDKLQHITALSFEINSLTREMQKIKGGKSKEKADSRL